MRASPNPLHLLCPLTMIAVLIFGCPNHPNPGQVPPPPGQSPHQANGVSPARTLITGPLPAGCKSQQSGNDVTLSCAIDNVFDGVPLHWTGSRVTPVAAPGKPTQPTSVTTSILTNGQLVVQLTRQFTPASGGAASPAPDQTVTYTYGPAVGGLQSAAFTITMGTVSGASNGRSIIPFKAAARPAAQAIKYADGQPPPTVTVAPALQAALTKLQSQVETTMPFGAAGGEVDP